MVYTESVRQHAVRERCLDQLENNQYFLRWSVMQTQSGMMRDVSVSFIFLASRVLLVWEARTRESTHLKHQASRVQRFSSFSENFIRKKDCFAV